MTLVKDSEVGVVSYKRSGEDRQGGHEMIRGHWRHRLDGYVDMSSNFDAFGIVDSWGDVGTTTLAVKSMCRRKRTFQTNTNAPHSYQHSMR